MGRKGEWNGEEDAVERNGGEDGAMNDMWGRRKEGPHVINPTGLQRGRFG